MIKIDYGNSVQRKHLEDLYCEIFESKKIDIKGDIDYVYKHYEKFQHQYSIFKKHSFVELIFKQPEQLSGFIKKTQKSITKLNEIEEEAILKYLKDIFNYDKYSSKLRQFFSSEYKLKTCVYCNQAYSTTFQKEGSKVSTFQLDHFYDKATYPYLALSFYNLIPSCATCNSRTVKASQDFYCEEIMILNHPNYDFHEKVKFKIDLAIFPVKDIDDFTIEFDISKGENHKKYIEAMYLKERYQFHKDVVLDLHDKHKRYPKEKIDEMSKTLGLTQGQIKSDIFGKIIFEPNPDLSSELLSKLRIDVAGQLGL